MNHGFPGRRIENRLSALPEAEASSVGENIDRRAKKLKNFIDSQDGYFGSDLDRISQQLRLEISGSYAARLFKRDLGIGVREYAKKKRLDLAAASLLSSALSVKEIAASVGYESAQDFSRAFRAMFKRTPSEFRNAERVTACECPGKTVTQFRLRGAGRI